MSNSHRRSSGKSDGALEVTGDQSIVIDGLQMQSNRLKILGDFAQLSSDRQSRLEGAASDIVGSVKTVLAKMDFLQQKQGRRRRNTRKHYLTNSPNDKTENDFRPHSSNAAEKLWTAVIRRRRRAGTNHANATTSSATETGHTADVDGKTIGTRSGNPGTTAGNASTDDWRR